jgi:hypothetical protein
MHEPESKSRGTIRPDRDPGSSIIVVTGLPRSGTSLMMRMLGAGGLALMTDGVRAADADNPFGYFELDRVRSLARDAGWLLAARGKAVKVISPLLPLLPREHAYNVLFMHRDLDEILASQVRMLEHRGEPGPLTDAHRLRAEFAVHLERTRHLLASDPAFAVLDLSYRGLIEASAQLVPGIARFLGRELDEAAMQACIAPDLYHNRLSPWPGRREG